MTTTNADNEGAIALVTDGQLDRLIENGKDNIKRRDVDGSTHDFWPVVKLFCPWGGATWLLTEVDPEDEDCAFGLCDLGMGCPELGDVRLSELAAVRGPAGLTIERDLHFKPIKSLSAYADEAREHGRIVA